MARSVSKSGSAGKLQKVTVRQENSLLLVYVLGSVIAMAIGICLLIWPELIGREERANTLLAGAVLILLVLLVTPGWVRRLIQHRKHSMQVYPEGFAYRERGTLKKFKWNEVGPFRLHAEDPDDVPVIMFDLMVPEPPKINGIFIEEPMQPMLPPWLDADAKDLNRFMNEYRNAALKQEGDRGKPS